MPDTALPSLLSRIEATTGADWEIDDAINHALGYQFHDYGALYDGYSFIGDSDQCHWTASVDAVLALIERELPGWGMSVSLKPGLGSWACVNEPDAVVEIVRGEAATPALALLAALIRAKIAQTE